jgi:hypothetical protein
MKDKRLDILIIGKPEKRLIDNKWIEKKGGYETSLKRAISPDFIYAARDARFHISPSGTTKIVEKKIEIIKLILRNIIKNINISIISIRKIWEFKRI